MNTKQTYTHANGKNIEIHRQTAFETYIYKFIVECESTSAQRLFYFHEREID